MDKQPHWIRIQYDPDQDHYLVDGAYKFTKPEINITSFEANKKLQMFLTAFFHEIELLKRQQRLENKQ